ncbi:MAG: nucleotidyltransferase domain-containing protein [Rhodocyclaceae bacterium]|nr:nucleotidyltransferase domain-containing protein [Rhodocyclaceae bacterium]
MTPISHNQRLAWVNSSQLCEAWRDATESWRGYRYGLRWKRVNGVDKLFRQADRLGNGRVIGPRDESSEQLLAEFQQGKLRARARLESLREKLAEQARMNVALRLARAPTLVGRVCRVLDEAGLRKDFLVIGTQAMFAYEAAAGAFFLTELLASGDIDLLFDARRKVTLVARKVDRSGLLGLLRKADRSFTVPHKGFFRAVNDEGFMVDLVIPRRPMTESAAISFGEDDLVAAEVPGLQWLINSPHIAETVIDAKGMPFVMRVPDPRAFALHKAWLSQQPERNRIKQPRDLDQARAVAAALREHMPQYPLDMNKLRALHGDVRRAVDLLVD